MSHTQRRSGSVISLQRIRQDVLIQAQIRHQLLQPSILVRQLFELLCLAGSHPTTALAPTIEVCGAGG